jgi:hypothetical protein
MWTASSGNALPQEIVASNLCWSEVDRGLSASHNTIEFLREWVAKIPGAQPRFNMSKPNALIERH